MSIAARRRVVVLIFIACVSILWLLLPRDASAQNRRRDREKKIAADASASPTSVPKANAPEQPRTDFSKSSRTRLGSPSGPIVPPSNASRTSYSDHFSLLSQKNIFLRNRPSMSRQSDNRPFYPSPSGPSRSQEESLVLTGILLEVDRPVAFIENGSNGTTQRLTLGDPIAHGIISNIGLDFLEYETNDGQVTRVEIGRTFTGEAPPAPPAAATSGPATTTSTAPASTDGGDDDDGGDAPPRPAVAPAPATPAPGAVDPNKANLSIEEKMKLKRQQELKK